MKKSILLNISCEEYHEIFLENMIQDYKTTTGKEITAEQIKTGLKWEKDVSRSKKVKNTAKIKLLEVNPFKLYIHKYTSNTTDLITKYIVEKIDEYQIRLTVIQKGKRMVLKGLKYHEVIDHEEKEEDFSFNEKRNYKKLEKYFKDKRKKQEQENE